MVCLVLQCDQFTLQHGFFDLHADHILLLAEAVGIARAGDLFQLVQQRQRLLRKLFAGAGVVVHGVCLLDAGRKIGPACVYLAVGLCCLGIGDIVLQVAFAEPGHSLHQRVARAAGS